MEFFFIKSIMALISFRSTIPPLLDNKSAFDLGSLSKKAEAEFAALLQQLFGFK